MSDIKIPLDAHIAATVALQKAWINCNSAEDAALAAIAAALEAWPGVRWDREKRVTRQARLKDRLILPLQEQTK
jgi:hypothetical protein